ncbi:RluA family pseudouridine synthase [Peptoniphilus equinus]|uniref:Pseudouridine synthase n=1 Tax=Peptoniphilus equinus TaxID=3016343 RepID=A0ABY7QU10_9FIRM|nr:RluA family pseudouridine synthase [Peptoniphilus equinus]WBW50217.1 RluA family pseudouridine synthase [Peptoniphilus equinus]
MDSLYFIADRETKQKAFLKTHISSRFLKSAIEHGQIYKNGVQTTTNVSLVPGDELRVDFKDEAPNGSVEHVPIDIVYEDQDVLVINKPPFMVTHTSRDDLEGTLLNATLGYFERIHLKRKARFVNRLDRDTSGLVIVAKNPYAHSLIAKQFRTHVEKDYLALVLGTPEDGLIDAPILRAEDGVRRIVHPDGKPSQTGVKVLKSFDDYSLVQLRLYTGRTHQIRVHMAHAGHPILGDTLYGTDDRLPRQALHSFSLKLKTPRSGWVMVKATLPADMRALLKN